MYKKISMGGIDQNLWNVGKKILRNNIFILRKQYIDIYIYI